MRIGRHEFDLKRKSYIMGILNVTPDSFSDGGQHNSLDSALLHTQRMIAEGAAIIDVGGESTRPGHEKITDEQEISRVVPVIEAIKKNFNIAVSLDTYKYEVAKAGIAAGADMINDIWGLKWDGRLAGLIAESGVCCCLMHNRDCQVQAGGQKNVETVKTAEAKAPEVVSSLGFFLQEETSCSFLVDFCRDMEETLALANRAGISRGKILLDPGVGFGKTYEQNLLIIKHLDVFSRWGYPVLLGTSRKSVIGLTLSLPPEEREEGTMATTVLGRMKGACIFRVHDVRANYRALKMADAILEAK